MWYPKDDVEQLKEYGWIGNNSGGKTHPVGTRYPNAFGLFDMHGNVWEWCADRYAPDYSANSPIKDPVGSLVGDSRVQRGGSWSGEPVIHRSAHRSKAATDAAASLMGFRVSMSHAEAAQTPAPTEDHELSFDGQGDFVAIPSLTFVGVDSLTVEAWVTPAEQVSTALPAVASNAQGSGFSLEISRSRGEVWNFEIHGKRQYHAARSQQPYAPGQRIHLAGVLDKTHVRLFVNGVLKATGPVVERPLKHSDYPLLIGANPGGGQQCWIIFYRPNRRITYLECFQIQG